MCARFWVLQCNSVVLAAGSGSGSGCGCGCCCGSVCCLCFVRSCCWWVLRCAAGAVVAVAPTNSPPHLAAFRVFAAVVAIVVFDESIVVCDLRC